MMKQIDVMSLAVPISADAPSGQDLEYDHSFAALEDAVRTEPEQQFGETVVAAEEPDWVTVRDLAVEILSRSKDLRAAVYLVQALVHGNGLSGLAQGLKLIRVLLETFWDSLHPQLDPDDDLDPTARVNIIASLCDTSLVLVPVRHAPMVQIPGLGAISLRDVQIANGRIAPPPDSGETLKLDTIEAAIRDIDLSVLKDKVAALEGAEGDVSLIEQIIMEKVGANHAVSLEALTHTLREILAFLHEQLIACGLAEQADVDDGNLTNAYAGSNAPNSPLNKRGLSEIKGPQDVVRTLDVVIDYYKVSEPSSPVPLLLERAKRLVSVGFLEILHDIAPDALIQAEQVTGASFETTE